MDWCIACDGEKARNPKGCPLDEVAFIGALRVILSGLNAGSPDPLLVVDIDGGGGNVKGN